MQKFRSKNAVIEEAASSLVSKMLAKGISSVEITSLGGTISLPGGGFIGTQKAIVSLSSDKKLIIRRSEREKETGYEYPLDADTIMWISGHKIPIHNVKI
jgi:hypothetical protein